MANYTPTFTKPYPNGWVDKPSKTTPATAAIMDSYDTAIAALEAYLRDNAIKSVSADTTIKSGTKIATITIDGTEYAIYAPNVSYESAITGGTKVGTITVGTNTFDVYAPASSTGGSTVSVVPKTLTGTNIAEITVDGTTYQLYAPTGGSGSGSTVTAEATLTEGTQIGKITIDGVETILYAPTASAITVDNELSATSENPVQNKVVKAEFDKIDDSLSVLGKCKNLLNPTLQTTTQNGVTCTNNGDGTYTLNGTATEWGFFNLNYKNLSTKSIPVGVYKVVGAGKDISLEVIASSKLLGGDNGNGYIFEIKTTDTNSWLRLTFSSGKTFNNVIVKPMITENVNATYDDFVPYTGDGDTLTADVASIKKKVDAGGTGGSITVDSTLSTESENPVQNKIITEKLNEVFQSVSDGKSLVASAITDKGVTTAAGATFQAMADNIGKISVSSGEVSGNNFKTGISMDIVLNFQDVTWNVTTDPNPSVSASFGEAIVTNWNGGSNIGVNIFTVYPIDLTNIKSIKIKYTESAHYGDTFPFLLGITSTKYMTVVDPRNTEFDKKVSNTTTGESEITMDVSDISGKKYIYIMPIGYTCTITDLILENEVDTRFEIKNPDLASTIKLGDCITGYYAYSAIQPTDDYWAIGMFAKTTEAFIIAIVVSTIPEYAYAVTSSYNTPYGGQSSLVYDDGKTYYFNTGIGGAQATGFDTIVNNIVPIYKVDDSNFTNDETGWTYMAKKLLDFYFGKETFPQ